MNVTEKLDLLAVGTRYDHYMELKEVFLSGIEIVNRMSEAHRSTGDEDIRKRLIVAVEMIEKRIAYLSDFTRETGWGSDLSRTLREIEMQRQAGKKLTAGGSSEPNDKEHS